jgi:methionyl aminopeptidase
MQHLERSNAALCSADFPGHPRSMPPFRAVYLGHRVSIETPQDLQGLQAVRMLDDGWTVATDDGSTAAHVEHTIVITADRPLVVTA